ncbi:MAG: sn-glycerol-3-phosphate ABC transporter ATP-binding protein UgpC [Candidatus Tectomicrobia bacterium]|uniref:Sn-glycerol-3-phosphate ABC transporter ATP-binding protein UgpC n=1 Tax=Tectimicrobiota bacterium TaxID=2528274 RepID=A0A932I1M7_UNCTE|nr:sn-glycerol-3-phosphate ABC transporter ATP-binding protein UgpC [Candidatus Tectomicrobia bacterium]
MGELVLESLGKKYGEVTAVKDVSLSIHDGEFVVFLGPSGCGKTTTLRMIAGLEEITSGSIHLDGRRLNDILPGERDIAMVFQNYALYPHMTVFKNMAFGLKMRKVPKGEIGERVARAADILGIQHLLHRYPRQLSGGQRQRVAVGRAIVRDPRVFLFDEPLSNLDAKLRVQTRVELLKLHRQLSATSVYVTHDQVEAMTMGDRIVVMLDGSVQQVGPPMEVYQNPANVFVAGFIGSPAMNFLPVRVAPEGGGDGLWLEGKGFRLPAPPGREARLAALRGKDLTLGVRPEDLLLRPAGPEGNVLRATIEIVEAVGSDIFLDLNLAGQTFTARVEATADVKAGQEVILHPNPGRVHLFDPESGKNLG